ncbi:hypothetical protein JQ574_28950 [Bradyrhizobium sp. AUGA SZCCT0158]|uniref:hypothetical protein n=1 Tax=Bradyrhizobium sp. AUGA SZCCT0158 TaxID=2807661 RepID=UPI001BADC659|nr:hypothetical protein [Bradyrhizobium sp. AUGA SZCCT0158]MBR1200026.1 hypothetical protein [Bradyrhizobium sp. AUGA SZCCT0158]
MPLRTQPSNEYIEALAIRALALHRASVAGNPIRAMVANAGMFMGSIERAVEQWGWPADLSPYIVGLVNAAMVEVLHNGRDLREAVATLHRVKRRIRRR